MSGGRALMLVGCLLAVAAPASAQLAFDARGYFTYGVTIFSAAETLDAVADKHRAPGIGGGVVLGGFWRSLFVDVGLSQQTLDGERVFVTDAREVFKLGIPLKLTFRPLDVAVGWRMKLGRYSPYGGIGLSRMNYEETSDDSAAGDNVSASRNGALIIGGVDVPVWRGVQVGGEVRYRAIKGILGEGGVSEVFDEDRLGGASAAVRISVGR
jgi:opacity protein-like surface antigen